MTGIAFGVAGRRTIPEVDLVPIMHKLAESSRSAARLARLAQTWIEGTQFTTHLSIAANSDSTIEVVVEASRTFPHDAWSVQMAGFAHQTRSALENLGSLAAERFSTSRYAKGGLQFPLCDDAHQWENWVKKHPFLPAWLVARYYAIQPFTGPYKGLHGLRLYNNKDKHEWPRPVRLSLTGLLLESDFQVEGIHEDGDIAGTLTPLDNVLNRHERRVKVSSWDVGHKVLELPDTAPHDVQVELYFDMGHAEYSSEEIRELARRVQLAVQYVATGNPEVHAAYEAKPKFLSESATQRPALVSTAGAGRPNPTE